MAWKSSFFSLFGIVAAGIAGLATPGAHAATNVGVTSAVNPQATGTPVGGASRTLVLGKKVFYNERIKTSAEGLVQLLLLDGSAFTIGPNSELRIDRFVYDPKTKTGEMVANFVKGAFRYVGGRLSKNKGGVTIRTSIATLGVRGGIVSGRVDGSGRGNFNFLFGKEMTVGTGCTGGAASCRNIKRVFQNGNTVQVNPGGRLDLRRTTRQDIAGLHKVLKGRAGRSGGARRRPTTRMVAQSEIVKVNSDQPPVQTAPTPKNAVQATPIVEVETVVVKPDTAAGDETREEVTDPHAAPPPPPPTEPAYRIRVLETSATYTLSGGFIVNNPGAAGLLGGDDADTDYTAAITTQGGRATAAYNGRTAELPYQTGSFSFTNGTGYTGVPLSGNGFVSPAEDFVFYELFQDETDSPGTPDRTAPIIGFGGTMPDFSAMTMDGKLRVFTLSPDHQQGTDIPFAQSLVVGDTSNAAITDLLIKYQNGGEIGVYPDYNASRTVALQASLLIDGMGSNQRSFANIMVAHVYQDPNDYDNDGPDVGPRLWTAYRGSFRTAADQGAAAHAGDVSTFRGPDNNHFFGADANYAVIGSDPRAKGSFYASFSSTPPPAGVFRDFATTHLAKFSHSIAESSLPTRTSRTLNGYATGMLELFSPGFAVPFETGDAPTGMHVSFNAPRNTLSADMSLSAPNFAVPLATYDLAFGSEPSQPGGGRSAFIDDDRYAAHHNKSATKIRLPSGDVVDFPSLNPDGSTYNRNPNTYFFGNELVPTTNFVPTNVSLCACKFLEWGYWGGRLRYRDPANANAHKDYFHLGTWVAGNVADVTSWPTTAVAAYKGHAIGNVARLNGSSVDRYLAVGNYTMAFDFSNRTGSAAITDFDGMAMVATTIHQSTNPGEESSYVGFLNGPISGSGSLAGAFVSGNGDAVGGTIGKFNFTDEGMGVIATGNIVAERLPVIP